MDMVSKVLMFSQILEGLATIVVGFVALFSKDGILARFAFILRTMIVLVDFPATAAFITPEERAFVVHKKSESAVSSRACADISQNTTTPVSEKRSTLK